MMSKTRMNRQTKKASKVAEKGLRLLIFLLLTVCVCSLPTAGFAADSDTQEQGSSKQETYSEKTVRVGYVNVEGYEEGGRDEYKTGYGYEYLQKISYYTGWKYEYVYGSFSDLEQMLEKGEIDLMGDISYMPEREGLFQFSAYPQGTEAFFLFSRQEDKTIDQSNIKELNGKKIGATKGSYQLKLLKNWLKENDIQAKIKEYSGAAKLIEGLENHEVSAIIMTDEASGYGYRPVYQIGMDEFYFAVSNDRNDILEDLNHALYKIQSANPNYNTIVNERYTDRSVNASFLDDDDKDWIKKHGKNVRIGYLAHNLPYSGNGNDDQPTSALDILAASMEEYFDITVETIPYYTINDLSAAVRNGEIDAAGPGYGDFYLTEIRDMVQTDPMLTTTPVVLYKGDKIKTETIAVTDTSLFYAGAVGIMFPDSDQILFQSEEECLDAVAAGKADCTIITSASLNSLKQYPSVKKLKYIEMLQKANLCMFTTKEEYQLASILDKAISLSEAELSGAIFIQSQYIEKDYTFMDFLKDNLLATMIIASVVVLAFLIVLAFLRKSTRSEHKARESEHEIRSLNEQLVESKASLEVALAAAEQASSSKTTFLSRMSHDIRTPMNGIIGMTAIAEAHLNDKERVRECLKKITGASNHLLSLINDVLDVSRIESGRMFLAEESFSLSKLLDDMISMTSSQIAEKHQNLSVGLCDITHENVIGDALRLQQVFMNIVGNAIKYTPDRGKITIGIRELPAAEEDIYSEYEFTCEDTGYGMKEEFIDKLFIPFERANDERLKNIQGTGLGMIITKNIVQLMDGNIKVESIYGKGSKFTVTFRLKQENDLQEETEAICGLSVLVVDDDETTCESTCLSLESLRVNCQYSTTGKEAVQRVIFAHETGEDFDVCLVDWKMPDVDCIELIRQLRIHGGENMAIIIISAYDWVEIEMDAKMAGADAFIMKPLFKSKLISKIKMVTKGEREETASDVTLDDFNEKDFSGKHVLLVEDNELNREIAREILEITGIDVIEAEDGSQALKLFEVSQENFYDLIIMDIQMPVMDGYQATRAIRNLNRSDASTVPIVAMSANAFLEDVENSKRAGMNAHISKPIDMAKLLGIMEDYMGKRVKRSAAQVEEKHDERAEASQYTEKLYIVKGAVSMSEDNEKACIDALEKNGAVGIFGLLEQKDFPIYCVSGFGLAALGYTFDELMEATDGYFIELLHPEDRLRFAEDFYQHDRRHHYRIRKKSGDYISMSAWSEETRLIDGVKAKMFSMRAE